MIEVKVNAKRMGRLLRKKRKMSYKALSVKTGLAASTLWRIQTNYNLEVTADAAIKIAVAFQLPIDYFIEVTNDGRPVTSTT